MARSSLALAAIMCVAIAACEKKSEVAVQQDSQIVVSTPDTIASAPPDTSRPIASPPKSSDRAPRPTAGQKNITVGAPHPGDVIRGNAIVIRGSARTFENGIAYKVLDARGKVISTGHGLTRGSMGQFGPFELTANVGNYTGHARLEVFDYSAKDGSEIDKVSVPIEIRRDTVGVGPGDRITPMPIKK